MQNNQNQFFGYLWKPSDSICFQGVTLKCGVYICSISDIIIANWNIFLIVDIIKFLKDYGDEEEISCGQRCIAFIFDNVLSTICIPFALIGFRGSQKQKVDQMKIYSVFKQVELVILFFWSIIYAILVMRSLTYTILFFIFRYSFDFYFTYVVWCAYQALKEGKNIGLMTSSQNIVQGIQISGSQPDNFSSVVIQQAAIVSSVPVQTIEMQNVREDKQDKEISVNA